MNSSWEKVLQQEFNSPYFNNLVAFVKEDYRNTRCFPRGSQIFNAFDSCPFDQVKVIILGQDPYHGQGQADGLCFSVPKDLPHPPSLKNIFKEIEIKDGWEMALGNILGARMHAYQALNFKDSSNKRPPHSVALITAKNVSTFTLNEKLTSALTMVNIKNSDIEPAISEWLAHTYISSSNDALANHKI